MTIICPRCAARFPVSSSPGNAALTPTCPSCGAKVQPRGDSTRRPSSSPEVRIVEKTAAQIAAGDKRPLDRPIDAATDLPLPKRPSKERSEPALSSAAATALAAVSSGQHQAVAQVQAQIYGNLATTPLRMSPELLRDLPAPLGPLPRQAVPLAARAPQIQLESAPLPNTRRRSPVPVARPPVAAAPFSAPPVAAPPVASPPVAMIAVPATAAPAKPISAPTMPVVARPAEVAPRQSRPDMPVAVAEPAPVPVVQAVIPAKPAAAAGQKASGSPSDSTAPEPIETMEHRMYGAVRTPSVASPGKDLALPAVPPPSVVAAATPQLALPSGPATPASGSDVAIAARPSKPPGKPATAPVTAAKTDVATPAPIELATPQVETPAAAITAPVAPVAPAVEAEPPLTTGPTAGPPEIIESAPELSEPPHLPMGWIIGALFMLALLLTLWIAHRAGAFGPPPLPPPIDPTTLPRMP